jgi:V8-like Glu-specific endopeptidase
MLAELPVEEEEAEAEELAAAAAAAEASAAPRPQQQQPKQQLLHHQQHPLARGAAGVLDGLSVPLGALVVNPFKGFGGKARQGGAGAAAAVAATSVPAGARIAAPLPPQQQQQQPQADPLASAASAIKRWTAWKRGFVAGGGTGAGAAAAAAAAPATTTAAATSAAAATTTAAQPRAVAVPAAGGVWVGKKSGTAAGTTGRRRMLQLSLVEPPQQQQHGRSAAADAAAGDCAPPSSSTRSRSLRSIIGAVDSRRPCPVGQWPYTALGQITGLAVDGDFLCSGALVGRDRVLTAAHCVWDDRDARTFFRDLSFTPAQYKTPQGVVRAPVGKVAWEHVTILQAYADDPNFGGLAFDVAVIKLKEPIGDTLGWIGYRAACEGGGAPLSLTLAGYPGDSPKTRADDAFLGGCYADACGVLYDCRSGTNNHTCDSYVGQSGAPMWDRAYYARMVHTLGVLPGFSTTNAGVTLTPFLVEMIARFM